jgi:hypothetical protein
MNLLIALFAVVASLPSAYTLQFENEWVRVTRVRYEPFEKLPAHGHTTFPSAYVYLSDSGPVIFRHTTGKRFAATRPAVKAGSFRVFRSVEELHEVENTSELASDFLRVEFKTEPKELETLRGRYHREAVAPGESPTKVQFENAQVRITRVTLALGTPLSITAAEPALLIHLSGPRPGREQWLSRGQTATFDGEAEFLRFDFKTDPEPGTRAPDPVS